MDVKDIVSNAAKGTAPNGASNSVVNTANNAINDTSALPSKAPTAPNSNNITQLSNSSSQKNNFDVNENNGDDLENTDNQDVSSNPNIKENSKQKSQDDNAYQAQNNQNVGPGKKIDENGNVVNTGSRKAIEAIGRGAAAYATGGESIGKEDLVTKNAIGDKALGVVSDIADKTPLAGEVLNDLGDSGAADAFNEALDTVGKAKNGDIKGAVDSAKKAKKDINKTLKHYGPKIALMAFAALFPIILVCVIIIAICGPVLGGFMDVTNAVGEFVNNVGDFLAGENAIGGTANQTQNLANTEQLLSDVPNYNSLNPIRKGILAAAASGIASGKPYHIRQGDNDPCSGKATGPGLDGIQACGIDCSGFVQWSLWTATGNKPFSGGTSNMVSSIGGVFEEISASELQPGDIGLKHKNSGGNHTGIYAGNGMWFHAANSNSGIIRSKYNGFTVFLRYKGVDEQ